MGDKKWIAFMACLTSSGFNIFNALGALRLGHDYWFWFSVFAVMWWAAMAGYVLRDRP